MANPFLLTTHNVFSLYKDVKMEKDAPMSTDFSKENTRRQTTFTFIVLKWCAVLQALLWAIALSGCVDITGAKKVSFQPSVVGADSHYAHLGHVYTMRGVLGIFSRGMDTLADRVERELGMRATALADTDWKRLSRYLKAEHKAGRLSRPLILVGHSFGGDDQVRVAKMLGLEGISVDLLVLVDPNMPPSIPANVKRCVDIYKSQPVTDAVPVLRGVKAKAVDPEKTDLVNFDLRSAKVTFSANGINHINIHNKPEVQAMVIAEIKSACFP